MAAKRPGAAVRRPGRSVYCWGLGADASQPTSRPCWLTPQCGQVPRLQPSPSVQPVGSVKWVRPLIPIPSALAWALGHPPPPRGPGRSPCPHRSPRCQPAAHRPGAVCSFTLRSVLPLACHLDFLPGLPVPPVVTCPGTLADCFQLARLYHPGPHFPVSPTPGGLWEGPGRALVKRKEAERRRGGGSCARLL